MAHELAGKSAVPSPQIKSSHGVDDDEGDGEVEGVGSGGVSPQASNLTSRQRYFTPVSSTIQVIEV